MKRFRERLLRKSILAVLIAASALSARTSFSQGRVGTVNFANTGSFPTSADRQVYDPVTCAPLVGANWVAALYFGTTPDAITELAVRNLDDTSLLRAIVRFRAVAPDHSSAGTWVGGVRLLPGTTVGQLLTLQIRVWDMNLFPTFEDAKAMGGYALASDPFSYRWSDALDANSMKINNFLGITPPECVPEPSVSVLTVFGIGLLLAWRRKKVKRQSLRTDQ